MRVVLSNAVQKMQGIHSHVSKVLTAGKEVAGVWYAVEEVCLVANAETAMYEWAYNVTVKVNSQTTKIVNVVAVAHSPSPGRRFFSARPRYGVSYCSNRQCRD